jgi:hypothetical protein
MQRIPSIQRKAYRATRDATIKKVRRLSSPSRPGRAAAAPHGARRVFVRSLHVARACRLSSSSTDCAGGSVSCDSSRRRAVRRSPSSGGGGGGGGMGRGARPTRVFDTVDSSIVRICSAARVLAS